MTSERLTPRRYIASPAPSSTIATADDWAKLAPAVTAERLRADSATLVAMKRMGNERLAARAQKLVEDDVRGGPAPKASVLTSGPRSLTIAPIDAEALREVSPDDARWLEQQRERYDNFDVVLFEAVNFMNGRPVNEIADLLSMEFADDFTPAWVDRLASVLSSIKLVALPAVR